MNVTLGVLGEYGEACAVGVESMVLGWATGALGWICRRTDFGRKGHNGVMYPLGVAVEEFFVVGRSARGRGTVDGT